MPRRKPSRRLLRSLCAEVHADDGLDPRDEAPGHPRKKSRRKTVQLCRQVLETLDGALIGAEPLGRLRVLAVEPAPDASRLLVTVGPLPSERIDPSEALACLQRAAPRLRCEVAASITRKRAPTLAFRLAIGAEALPLS